jgi:hypothetical protein
VTRDGGGRRAPSTASAGTFLERYFFAHLFAAVSHIPPAFSQSACVVCWLKSPDVEVELGEGLADGEAPDPDGPPPDVAPEPVAPDVPDGDPEPEPVAPDVPDGAPEPDPEPPAAPLPLPEPVWAATSAGVSAMIATSRAAKSFVMLRPPSV